MHLFVTPIVETGSPAASMASSDEFDPPSAPPSPVARAPVFEGYLAEKEYTEVVSSSRWIETIAWIRTLSNIMQHVTS